MPTYLRTSNGRAWHVVKKLMPSWSPKSTPLTYCSLHLNWYDKYRVVTLLAPKIRDAVCRNCQRAIDAELTIRQPVV
jgi:hypothetical protein